MVILYLIVIPGLGQSRDFDELSTLYFTDRSVEYANELLLKEEYLEILYESVVKEFKKRRVEDSAPLQITSTLGKVEPAHFDLNNPEIASAGIAQRYQLWVDFEEREFQRRFQNILGLRNTIIEQATPAQKHRMFRHELEISLKYYADEDWDIASLLFDRLLSDYHYDEMDDILFYQSQVRIQQGHLDAGLSYLMQLLEGNPESEYRAKAYDQATEILQRFSEDWDMLILYRAYLKEGVPGEPLEMGGIHLRAARAEVNMGHFQSAVTMLERVDTQSPYYLASRYFLADCLTAMEEWALSVDVLTEMVNLKQKNLSYDRWRMLIDEAKIKLAYIYYESGDYETASDLFKQVKRSSPFYDRVLMGNAWIAYKLDNYEMSIEKAEELLNTYPLSTEIYEAGSLAGYCCEQTGSKNTAMEHFYEVLEAGVGQGKLKTFQKERRRIANAFAQLNAVEEEVFSSGDEVAFSEYKRARNQLLLCQRRVGLAELLEVNASMRALVEERVILDRLLAEKDSLEDVVISADDAGLIANLLALEDRIFTIMDDIKNAGNKGIKATPLYYRESQIGYINLVADTLSSRVESEIETLVAHINSAEDMYQTALTSGKAEDCLQYGLQLDHLNGMLSKSYYNHTLSETSHRPVLKTRVDRWSDFSFNRYAMGGMEFDELESMYERLKQVEGYLLTLDEMVDVRDTGAQSGNMVPTSTGENSETGGNETE
ncbi:hypothetical protein CEE37_00550 [candidate division LCP-89 bacterium B3_LCP]|uniref:Uncharacterized protein n=1 Tax=candidate division LCP-89 bacterium B3_LCP TaxID=2012998 RepID=A0A532V4R9_UNCL8|nr:MAG: hypothetical protein CEE37_00550 [candidate division LCP-89 bacterium B3_LCP]